MDWRTQARTSLNWFLDTGRWFAFVRGMFTTLGVRAVVFGMNLWLVAACIRVLGAEYGYWLAGYAATSIIGVIQFGLGEYLVKEVAVLETADADHRAWSGLLSTVLMLRMALGAVYALVIWFAAPYVALLVIPEKVLQADLIFAFRLGGFYLLLQQLTQTWSGCLHGLQRLGTFGSLELFENVGLTVSTLVLLHVWPFVWIVPIGHIVSILFSFTVAFITIPSKIRSALRPSLVIDRARLRDIWCYGRPFLSVKIAHAVKERTDQPIAAHFLGGGAVVMYAVTQRLVRSVPMMLLGMASTLSMPAISDLSAGSNLSRVRMIFLNGLRNLCIIGVIGGAVLWASNSPFVELWVGSAKYGGSLLSLFFCTWIMTELFSRSMLVILIATEGVGKVAPFLVLEAILNIVLSLLLVRHLGLVGIALGTTLATVATTFWAVPRTVFRLLDISWPDVSMIFDPKFLLRLAVVCGAISWTAILLSDNHIWLRLTLPWSVAAGLTLIWFRDDLTRWFRSFR